MTELQFSYKPSEAWDARPDNHDDDVMQVMHTRRPGIAARYKREAEDTQIFKRIRNKMVGENNGPAACCRRREAAGIIRRTKIMGGGAVVVTNDTLAHSGRVSTLLQAIKLVSTRI
jgi:hypothetical protein